MSTFKLLAQERTQIGKSASSKLRKAGFILGNYSYANKDKTIKNVALNITPGNLRKLFDSPKKLNTVVEITTEEGSLKSAHALVTDIAKHPLTGKITHIDFRGIADDQIVVATVPVDFIGKPKGVEAGGTLRKVVRTVQIKAKAVDVPSEIKIDVTEIGLGKHLLVSEITLPKGVVPVYKQNFAVALVDVPKAAEEAAATPAAAAPAAKAAAPAAAAAPAKAAAKPAAKK